MSIITLTTDMGLKDHYVAVVKGAILSQHPEAIIVDVSHGIKPFDNAQAAYVLRNAFPAFPPGAVPPILPPGFEGRFGRPGMRPEQPPKPREPKPERD